MPCSVNLYPCSHPMATFESLTRVCTLDHRLKGDTCTTVGAIRQKKRRKGGDGGAEGDLSEHKWADVLPKPGTIR